MFKIYTGVSINIAIDDQTKIKRLYNIASRFLPMLTLDENDPNFNQAIYQQTHEVVLGYVREDTVFTEDELDIIYHLANKIDMNYYDKHDIFALDPNDLPKDTPEDKQFFCIEHTIDELLYIYVPLTGYYEDTQRRAAYIMDVVANIFQTDVVQIAKLKRVPHKTYNPENAKILYSRKQQ